MAYVSVQRMRRDCGFNYYSQDLCNLAKVSLVASDELIMRTIQSATRFDVAIDTEFIVCAHGKKLGKMQ